MNFPNITLTNAGMQAILDALAGTDIVFSKIKIGDGTAPATTAAIRALTDIVSPKYTCGIANITMENNCAILSFNFDNAHIGNTGFYARELGVYMTDENDNDVLYGYTNAGTDCGYIKPFDQDSFIMTQFRVAVAVGDAENVTAIIAPAIGFVSDEDFRAHLDDHDNPHEVTKDQIGLGNVLNYAPSAMPITFTTAANIDQIQTGATLAVIAGKLNRALIELANSGQSAPSDMTINFTEASSLTIPTTGADMKTLMGTLAKAVDELSRHLSNNQNPHEVTKEQLGLGNVPNQAPSNMTINFSEASTLAVPSTGATLATLIGTLAKAVDDLIAHIANHENPHQVTYADVGAASQTHKHSAADITAGTLPVNRGGTGVTTLEALVAAVAATPAETRTYLGLD